MVAHWRLTNASRTRSCLYLPCSLQIAHVALVAVEDEKEEEEEWSGGGGGVTERANAD